MNVKCQINFDWGPDYSHISPTCMDLLKRMLEVNPYDRISSKDALKHEYFKEDNNETWLPAELMKMQF